MYGPSSMRKIVDALLGTMSRTKISGNSKTVSMLARRDLLLMRIDLSNHRIIVVSMRD